MSKAAVCRLIAGFLVFVGSLPAQSSNEIRLGAVTAPRGSVASIPLTLSTTDEVEGVVASFEWDAAGGTGTDLLPGSAVSGADVVVRRVGTSYMVLGAVIDSDGTGNHFIPPGQNLDLGTAKVQAADLDAETTVALVFVDGKYNTVENGPLLENVVTVGGLSITQDKGLVLTNGSLTVTPVAPSFTYKIANGSSSGANDCGSAKVLLDSSDPIEGYEIALESPDELTLQKIDVGKAATDNGADFTDTEIVAGGGTVGVVLDLVAPFQGNKIPAGADQEIAVFTYCCKARPQAPSPAVEHPLTFGTLGSPAISNTVVRDGQSVVPTLEDGKFVCTPEEGTPEDCDNDIDDDGDELVDCDDPDCRNDPACVPPGSALTCGAKELDEDDLPVPVDGVIGQAAEVCFFYKAPDESIQGLSMSISTPCDLKAQEGTFDITGTIVEAVAAEYVEHQSDTDPADGDGCELIVGILVDSMPPFAGTTLPATDVYLRVGCIKFSIENDPQLAGRCIDVTFQDGLNGRGKVPVHNLISVDNQSKAPQLASCQVCVRGEEKFYRGDCNFSNEPGGLAVDIADAAATVGFIMGQGPGAFQPPCLDACDCNDDGRIDLADVLCVLKYLFELGPFPPEPGPGLRETGNPNPNRVEPAPAGSDPTPDTLDCRGVAA